MKMILAIETSCDDTSVALVREDAFVSDLLTLNQNTKHEVFGGVVPEVASRVHTEALIVLIDRLLKGANMKASDLSALAVTARPGLIGSLMVGVMVAKTLAYCWKKPLIGVNHLHAHLFAPFLKDETYTPAFSHELPFISLAVSGGHTHLCLVEGISKIMICGQTQDDAAGEALDKFAKSLGLGFPGGERVDRISKGADYTKYSFPRPKQYDKDLHFSFSGLKTAAINLLNSLSEEEKLDQQKNLCASFQFAVVDVLIKKLNLMIDKFSKVKHLSITGGVSANSFLRCQTEALALQRGLDLAIPPLKYCTDNAAMVGFVGWQHLKGNKVSSWDLQPEARNKTEDFSFLTDR